MANIIYREFFIEHGNHNLNISEKGGGVEPPEAHPPWSPGVSVIGYMYVCLVDGISLKL